MGDHEGGNVSAHTSHLVGSTLADPYLSFAAAMDGLAGPLHGLANQEVLVWLTQLRKDLGGKNVSDKELHDFIWNTFQTTTCSNWSPRSTNLFQTSSWPKVKPRTHG